MIEKNVLMSNYTEVNTGANDIVCLVIDTDKPKFEIKQEVVSYVDKLISDGLNQYKDMLTAEEFSDVTREMIQKRNKMIRSFMIQIDNMEIIEREVIKSVNHVMNEEESGSQHDIHKETKQDKSSLDSSEDDYLGTLNMDYITEI